MAMWFVNILNANSDSWCPVWSVCYTNQSQTLSANMTTDCMIQSYPKQKKGVEESYCLSECLSHPSYMKKVVGTTSSVKAYSDCIACSADAYFEIIFRWAEVHLVYYYRLQNNSYMVKWTAQFQLLLCLCHGFSINMTPLLRFSLSSPWVSILKVCHWYF